jgi:hypothetical protein
MIVIDLEFFILGFEEVPGDASPGSDAGAKGERRNGESRPCHDG